MYEELLYANESSTLDFKREQYRFINEDSHVKSELLKDILAFANSWRNESAHILIGVEENKDGKAKILGISNDLDDAQLQQFVNGKTQIPVNFIYKNTNLDGKKIGIIEITHTQRPVYLKKDFGKLKKNIVYIRRGSSTSEASPEEIFDMGKKEKEKSSIPNISISFSDDKDKKDLGNKLSSKVTGIELPNNKEIPDFLGESDRNKNNSLSSIYRDTFQIETKRPNKDYYRSLFDHYSVTMKLIRITFCVNNSSQVLASGVVISMLIPESDDYFLIKEESIPKKINMYESNFSHIIAPIISKKNLTEKPKKISIEKLSNGWMVKINVDKVLPNSTSFINEKINIFTKNTHNIKIPTTIHGENIPIPIKQNLYIENTFANEHYGLDKILELEKTNF